MNDTVALCPPVFRRENEAQHIPTQFQQAIWRAWVEYWVLVGEYKARLDATVYGLAVGDLGDLNKYSDAELISPLRTDVERAMLDVHKVAEPVVDHWVVIRGTEAHVGAAGELEEWFASDLDNAIPSFEGQKSWYVWRAEIGGVRLHVTHHPPTRTKITSKHGQAVGRMCERLAGEYDARGWKKPQLAIWAHTHWCAPGWDMGIWGWTVPPMKGLGIFGKRIGVTLPNPVGGLIVILPGDGTWNVKDFLRDPPAMRPRIWTPSLLES